MITYVVLEESQHDGVTVALVTADRELAIDKQAQIRKEWESVVGGNKRWGAIYVWDSGVMGVIEVY